MIPLFYLMVEKESKFSLFINTVVQVGIFFFGGVGRGRETNAVLLSFRLVV